MKKLMIIPLLLVFALTFTACLQMDMKKLKEACVYHEEFGIHGIGNYAENRLVMFILDSDGDFYFKGYDFEGFHSFQLGSIGDIYHYSESPFMPLGYEPEVGLFVQEYMFLENISMIEFAKKAKPLIKFLQMNPQNVFDVMEQAASDLGLVEEKIEGPVT